MDEKPETGEDTAKKPEIIDISVFKAQSVLQQKTIEPLIQKAKEVAASIRDEPKPAGDGEFQERKRSQEPRREGIGHANDSERRKCGFESDANKEPPVVFRPYLNVPKKIVQDEVITISDSDDEQGPPIFNGGVDRSPPNLGDEPLPRDEPITSELPNRGNCYTYLDTGNQAKNPPPSTYSRTAQRGERRGRGSGIKRRDQGERWANGRYFSASNNEIPQGQQPPPEREQRNGAQDASWADYPGTKASRGRRF